MAPINPADLALKQSRIDSHVDAEALFREVHISNEQHGVAYPQSISAEYVRIKIFTERGKEFANVELPFFRKERIDGVQGRTIHPDGSIVELGKDAIFSKVLEKRGRKTKIVTFAMPAVEPGSIIEYRYRKREEEMPRRYQPLDVQTEYPIDELTFFVKPLSNAYISYPQMRYMPFGCSPEREKPTIDGFEVFKVKNVPAFHQEPFSPPSYNAREWILIYYEENAKTGQDEYWTSLGKYLHREYGLHIKVNGEVKALAEQIIGNAATDNEKLEKLLAYCRTELKDSDLDEVATADRDEAKVNRTTLDTIQRKQGTTVDINYVFLALAQAAGFDARRADLSDRATFLFSPSMQSRYFLNSFAIAVNVGGKWQFYDVTNPAIPGGQLRWQEQGVYALLTDGKHPEMVQTPQLSTTQNLERRIANLSLSEDGVLEGAIREMKFGNYASEWRESNRYTNEAQREEALREELKSRFADFDVSDVHFAASADVSKPVGVMYHIVVRGYAQRTGKRLLVQPAYFAAGLDSRFTESTRYNNIYFEFPWSEYDTIELKLPAGFTLERADAPAGVNAPPACAYKVSLSVDKAKNVLSYERKLTFGGDALVLFDKKTYPALKKVFDTMHESDNDMLTLKAGEIAAAQ